MKKIICILLAVAMLTVYMPTMAATTTFSDVANNSSYKNAIYTLADFGIILGDAGSDTFRPQANISREEFSVIMTRVLGLGALNVSVTDYPFPDVTPSTAADWSIKATKIAYDLGIIKGFDDGTFRPKENVTFEQAVKMIVCALGYDGSAQEQGGWPNGYIAVARGFGILNGAEAPQALPATREIIAQLVANSLEVPLAETEVGENRSFLTEKLRYTEGTGIVTGVEGKALKSTASGITADEVQINYAVKFKVGDTSAKDYFGKQIKYYYKDDGVDKTLVSARLTNKNKEVTVLSSQIKELYPTKLEYYPDVNDITNFETYEFEAGTDNVSAIYNGKYTSNITNALKPDSGSIRLIDNNGNGAYDVLIIDATEVFVVSSVDSTNKIIYDEYVEDHKVNLDATTGQVDIKITKANTEVDFSQIKKGDVLLVSESLSPVGRQSKYVEIVTNTVSGNVTSMNEAFGEVIIAGKTYEYSNAYARYLATSKGSKEKMRIGDKVTVYLDNDNKILAASVTSVAATTKYGYLIATSEPDDARQDEELILRIYSDNKAVNYKGATKIKINERSYDYDAVPDILAGTNSVTNQDAGKVNYARAQLIKFTTNSSGQVDNIYTMQTSGDSDKGLVISRQYQPNVTYTSTGRQLGSNVTLSTSTKVLFIPDNRKDTEEYSTGTYSKLKNGKQYSFEAYDSSETGVPAIILVYGSSGATALNEVLVTFALVDTVRDTMKDGEPITALTCKVDGSNKTYYAKDSSILANYGKGDVIKLAFDAKGYIIAAASAFDFDNVPAAGTSKSFNKNNRPALDASDTYARYVYDTDGTNSYTTVYGTVYARDTERITIAVPDDIAADGTASATKTITLSSSTKIFVLDTTVEEKSDKRLTEGTIEQIASYVGSKTGASKAYTYTRDNVTRFIIVVK